MLLTLVSITVLSQPLSADCRDHLPRLRQAFLDADETAFRYLLADVPAAGLRRGEVVLSLPPPGQLEVWRGLSADEVRVANVNGDVRHVKPAMLSPRRPAKVVVPTQMSSVSSGVFPDVCLAPVDRRDALQADAEQLSAERSVAQACAEERLSKLDTTTAGASRYDLVTSRGGRVTSVRNYGDVLYAKAWKQCGGSKVEALEQKLGQRIDDAWRESWKAHRDAVVKRFLEAPRGPSAKAVVPADDEAM